MSPVGSAASTSWSSAAAWGSSPAPFPDADADAGHPPGKISAADHSTHPAVTVLDLVELNLEERKLG